MKSTVYIETSIVSYLAARPSQSVIVAAHQASTWQWWDSKRHEYDLHTSLSVLDESAKGDSEAAARRMQFLEGMTVLSANDAAIELSNRLLREVPLPSHALTDALHIAIAAMNGLRFLLTWNCTHIANAVLRPRIEQVCRSAGCEPPIICTPEELLNG